MRSLIGTSLSAIAATMMLSQPAAAAAAQQEVPPEAGADDDSAVMGEIVVIARSMRGAVIAPQPPVLELDPEEIAAYGVSSISDLVAALGPQTGSGRGRGGGFPAILVNGTRVSNFRELSSYPPEAIERVEVFPEEVALRYGFSADQRVINFILRDNYSSRTIEVEYGQPFDGGYSDKEVQGTYLLINGPTRYNVNVEWSDSSLLTEAERGVVQSVMPDLPGDPDPAAFRSLSSDSSDLEITGNLTTLLADNGTALSVNGSFERENSLRWQGLDTVQLTDADGATALRSFNIDDPLTVHSRTNTYSLGSTLNMPLGRWQMTATLDGSHAESRSRTQRRLSPANSPALQELVDAVAAGELALDTALDGLPDAGFDQANTLADNASGLVTVSGSPIWLPGGDVSVTFNTGYDWQRIRSEDTRNPGVRTSLQRGDLSAGVNLGVPITSVRDDFGAAIGDLSLNASAGINHLSDFGTLTDWTLGLTWSPFDPLTFNASYIARDAAPGLGQLGNPEIATPNVPIFDLTNGETVLATVISGGNPFLPEQRQRDWKVGAMLQLPFLERSNLSVDYFRNRSDNVSASFPELTPEIEAAFPDRITRDGAGQLIQIDQRPVVFSQQRSERIQVGLNLSGPLGTARADESGPNGSPQARGPGGFPGGPGSAQGAPGMAGGQFDPERMAEMRQRLCASDEPLELTPEMLAELPEPLQQRLRGDDGQIDPQRVEEFRTRICSQDGPPTGDGQFAQGQGQQAAPAGPGMFGRGRGPGGPGGGQGRWFANLQYTHELNNTVLVAPGGPVLDLLDGDALTGGGQPRHSAALSGGFFYNGFGARYGMRYTGSSRLDGTGLPGSTDLRFHDLLTVDLRLFADLNQRASLIESVPLLQNTRISFSLDNVFDARQRVTDSNGDVPLRYQPFLVDPVGRYFEVELRKLF